MAINAQTPNAKRHAPNAKNQTPDIIAQGETRWARIRTRALTDDAAEAAALLAEQSEGWAYLLSDLALDRLLRPLGEIADPRAGAPDAP